MKKQLWILLALAMLLTGCTSEGQRLKEPVTFYYLMDSYQFGEEPKVFATDLREGAGHRHDLSYLLTLYLMGPSQEGLASPLPKQTRILSLSQTLHTIQITLSDTSDILSDIDFTRACACLTMTCTQLTGIGTVTVESGSRSVTMTQDTMLLFDDSLRAAQEETQ